MQLTKVRLKNFGPYKDFTHELSQGLIGIIGPNGSGKSTLVNGIYACLTNDFSRFDGRKSGIICDTADERDRSLVEICGDHNGVSFKLTRNLRPNSAKLIMGDMSYTKAADIEKYLIKDLGLNRKLIDAYVFVNQWDMFSFLSQTDSKRAEVFQSLCRTEKSVDIYAACTKFVADERFSMNVIDNSDEIKTQLSLLQKELKKLQVQRETYSQHLMKDKSRESAQKVITRFGVLVTQHEELLDCKLSFNKASRRRQSLKSTLIAAKQECDKLDGFVKSATVKLSGLETEQLRHQEAQHANARRTELLSSLAKNKKLKPELEIPEKKVCPTCGQQVNNDKLIEITNKQHQNKLRSYNKTVSDIQSYLDVIEVNEECLEFNYDVLRSVRSTASMSRDEQTKVISNIVEVEKDLARAEGEAFAKRQRMNDLETRLRGSSLDEYNKLYDRAQLRLQEHEICKAKVDSIDGSISVKKESIEHHEKLLDSLQKQITKRARYDDLLHVVKEAQALFHWQKLPRQVAQANLSAITGEINAGLENFGDPFWVEADANLSFKIHFPGAPVRLAGALSGGQKVVLAICFRSAVNRLFGDNIGMMFLDEPTSGLDDANIGYFRDVLTQMASKIRDKYQLFVITHAEALSSAFDRTVLVDV